MSVNNRYTGNVGAAKIGCECAGGMNLGSEKKVAALVGSRIGANPMACTHEWHQRIIESFVATLKGPATPVASGDLALAAHDFIDATIRSAKNGKTERLNT